MFKSLARAARLSLAKNLCSAQPPAPAHCSSIPRGCFHSYSSANCAQPFLCSGSCHVSGSFLNHVDLHEASPIGGRRCTYTWANGYDIPPTYTPPHSKRKSAARRVNLSGEERKVRPRNLRMSSMSMLEQDLAADFIPLPASDLQTRRKSMGGVRPRRLTKTSAVWASPETALGYSGSGQFGDMTSAATALRHSPLSTFHVPMLDPLPVTTSGSVPGAELESISVALDDEPAVTNSLPTAQPTPDETATTSLPDRLEQIRTTLDEATLSTLTSTVPILPYPTLPSITSLQPSKLTGSCYMDLSTKLHTDDLFTFACDPYQPQRLHYHSGQPFPEETHGFLYYSQSQSTFLKGELRFKVTSTSDPSSFSHGEDLRLPSGERWRVPLLFASPTTREQLQHENVLSLEQCKDLDFVISQIGGKWRKGDQILFNLKDEFCIDLGRYGSGRSKQGVWVIGDEMKCGKVWVGGTGAGLSGALRVRFEPLPSSAQGRTLVLRIMKILEPIVVPPPPEESKSKPNPNPKPEPEPKPKPKPNVASPYNHATVAYDIPRTWLEAQQKKEEQKKKVRVDERYSFLPAEGKLLQNPFSGRLWCVGVDLAGWGMQCLRFLCPKEP